MLGSLMGCGGSVSCCVKVGSIAGIIDDGLRPGHLKIIEEHY
jgi:hypothetical protein